MNNRQAAQLTMSVLALMAAGGCKKSEGPSGPNASYLGGWTGTTSQGRVFRFYVTDGGIVLAVVGFRVVGTSCTDDVDVFLAREEADTEFQITDGDLSILTSGSSGSITLTGSFTSASQASGTLAVNAVVCGGAINETWTANKATGAEADFTGTWAGTYSSSLVPPTSITFTMSQSGKNMSGSFVSANGGVGTISGTVSGRFAAFRIIQTTVGCPGTLDGHATVMEGTPNYMFFAYTGSDCLGSHTDAGGFADKQ